MRTASVFSPRSTSQLSNGAGHAADRVLQEVQALVQPVVGGDQRAADHVRVAAQVLGGAVVHDVGAQLQRPLAVRAGEGVVDGDDDVARVGQARDGRDIDELEQRIGRALEPDEARALLDGGLDVVDARGVDKRETQADAFEHAVEQAKRAAVDVVAGHDVVAGARTGAAACLRRPCRWRRPVRSGRRRATPGRPRAPSGSGWPCANSRSPCVRRPPTGHTCWSDRSARSRRRWSGRPPGRRGSPAWRSPSTSSGSSEIIGGCAGRGCAGRRIRADRAW